MLKLAQLGADKLPRMDLRFKDAINTNRDVLTNQPVAESHNLEFEPLGV